MRKTLRRVTPKPLHKVIGKTISETNMLYRDSANVRRTARNLAPALLNKTLKLDFKRPKVSVVFVGRNDDFVADNEARVRAMIEWNSQILCDEMIFVEWNPIMDRPFLSLGLTRDYPHLRAYVVHPEIHAQLCDHPRMPVLEEFGKNVGIRRAKHEYICVTNCYIFWDQNVKRIARLLKRDSIFRTRRVELNWHGDPPTQSYLRDPKNRAEFRLGWKQELEYGCGDFTLAHRDLWHRARGYDESLRNQRVNCDGRGLHQLMTHGGKPMHLGLHYHLMHQSSTIFIMEGREAHQSAIKNAHGGPFEYWKNLPYHNTASWGLGDCEEQPLAERVWMIRRR